MNLTTKETDLLNDLKKQEQLCITKYDRYAAASCSTELKKLFSSISQTERQHLQTVNELLGGTVSPVSETISNGNNCNCGCASYNDEASKQNDEFMCNDMLASEKHVSSMYDVSVFEFSNPEMRKALNHIQAEEQQHGEQLYAYMNANDMYC